MVMGMLAVFGGAAGVYAQRADTEKDPSAGLRLSDDTLAAATQRGKTLLEHPKWTIPAANFTAWIRANEKAVLYTFQRDGKQNMAAADITSGQKLWSVDLTTVMPPNGGLVLSTATALEILVQGNNEIVLYDPAVQAARWRSDYPSRLPAMPLIADKQVILGTEGDGKGGGLMEVRCLDRATGRQQWNWPTPAGLRQTGVPILAGGRVVLAPIRYGDKPRFWLVTLDGEKGKMIWETPDAGEDFWSPVTCQDM